MKWLIIAISVSCILSLGASAHAQEPSTICDLQTVEVVDENCINTDQSTLQSTEGSVNEDIPVEKGEPNPETVAGTPAELAPQPEVLGTSTTSTAPTLVDTGTQTWPYILIGILIILESVTLFKFTSDIN